MSVSAKVVDITAPTTLDDGHVVQNIIVSDATGTAKVALWQNFVNSVTLNNGPTTQHVTWEGKGLDKILKGEYVLEYETNEPIYPRLILCFLIILT